MTPAAIPEPSALSAAVQLELSTHGGHVGYISGGTPWNPVYYLPERIIAFLKLQLSN